MVARPAPNFPDALARNPQPLKFVPVDEQLALDDGTMRVDVYHAVGHLHMAEAVFAYIPGPRIFLEGDFTTTTGIGTGGAGRISTTSNATA